MVAENINDRSKWGRFVEKLAADTLTDSVVWKAIDRPNARDRIVGPLFVAEILPEKYVGVYRYNFEEWIDAIDGFITSESAAVELTNSNGDSIWRLPAVGERHALLDAIEFKHAGASDVLDAFLGEATLS